MRKNNKLQKIIVYFLGLKGVMSQHREGTIYQLNKTVLKKLLKEIISLFSIETTITLVNMKPIYLATALNRI